MGTPEFAVPALDALIAAGHEIAAVYTQPPRPARRGQRACASPVQDAAEARGLPVRIPPGFRDESEQAAFAGLDADIAVVAAYGLILPAAVLEAPARGCLNIHASLLPRWRGAAPIQRAILAGDRQTGVTIMRMERGLDTGPTLLGDEIPIDRKTAGELSNELAAMGGTLIVETLAALDRLPPRPQPTDGVTYAAKIDKAEAHLDFRLPAEAVERAVRAFNPVPGAFALLGEERLRILEAELVDARGEPGTVLDSALTIACGTGAIRPRRVQRPGKRPMAAAEMLRGLAVPPGISLG